VCQSQPDFAEMILGWSPFKIVAVSTVLYPRKAHHYAYTVQIWALSGLKLRSFGHLKKFLFLVMAVILDTGRR
jgi:hypothetical protein